MEHTKKKLTPVQRLGINEKIFELAYNIVTTNRNEEDIRKEIKKEMKKCINLKADLTRYCKLARSVM